VICQVEKLKVQKCLRAQKCNTNEVYLEYKREVFLPFFIH
jgi:hypothetical protein